MKNKLLFSMLCLFFMACNGIEKQVSPNGKIELSYAADENQNHSFKVTYLDAEGAQEVLDMPAIGITTTNGIGTNLTLKQVSKAKPISENYTMLVGKRKVCSNEANEYTYLFVDSLQTEISLVFRLYNDGIAFRYEIPAQEELLVKEELTTYRIPEGRERWIQSYDPGYEQFFPKSDTGKGRKQEWCYPALFQVSDNVWTLMSEAGIEKFHSSSYLKNDSELTDYKVAMDVNEKAFSGDWFSPWRVVIIGSLADVVESTLITDVSPESRIEDTSWIEPGVVSWIYWAYNHGSNDYQIVKKYIDMAKELKLPYMLIDAEWDEMANGGDIEDAIEYAKASGVKPLLWYNSSTAWIKEWGAPGPHERLNDPEKREKEFAWLEKMGVAGVKIDFFAGDKQETMQYYIELLECAIKHKLLVNFHGATIPRGWQRTYPNMMTMEAVYGAEWYNNLPILTNRAAAHNATLPFTRNVIGPMDYTPCTFSDSQHPHITTHGHELALTVLFESALQHLADRPESYMAQPDAVQNFLSNLPSTWDETKLLSGYPGEYVVMARQNGDKWYVAGINGKDEKQTIDLDWSFLDGKDVKATLFLEGETSQSWCIENFEGNAANLMKKNELLPRGGFVVELRNNLLIANH